jgi:hypothetical protein
MGAQGQQAQAPPPQPTSPNQPDSQPTSAREAIGKSLGGMFGHKKKQSDQDNANNSGSSSSQPSSGSGSLMDVQTEVTSFSNSPLNKDLFEIPAGFTPVPRDPDEMMGGRKK